tara:strand:- start:725 stop:1198 length:474 start_codon:yes stop_codon:yes gene_type:complete
VIGQKHLIECHCSLPIFKDKEAITYHKFVVYSKFDERGSIIPKYAQCNNCGANHHVFEMCRSEIKIGKEDNNVALTIEDVSIGLPDKVVGVLKKYECGIEIYEEVNDVIENNLYPHSVIVNRELVDDNYEIKIINLVSQDRIKIEAERISRVIIGAV